MTKPSLTNSANKQKIVERLGRIQLDSPRQWGRMTVNQMICHRSDSFRVTMGLKPWKTAPDFGDADSPSHLVCKVGGT